MSTRALGVTPAPEYVWSSHVFPMFKCIALFTFFIVFRDRSVKIVLENHHDLVMSGCSHNFAQMGHDSNCAGAIVIAKLVCLHTFM